MSIKCKDIIPPHLDQELAQLGANLRLARKRRKWSMETVRQKIKCSKGTLQDAEKGRPTVSFGVYLMLFDLYGFQLDLPGLTHPSHDQIGWSMADIAAAADNELDISPEDF